MIIKNNLKFDNVLYEKTKQLNLILEQIQIDNKTKINLQGLNYIKFNEEINKYTDYLNNYFSDKEIQMIYLNNRSIE